jgi:hypothetical protein
MRHPSSALLYRWLADSAAFVTTSSAPASAPSAFPSPPAGNGAKTFPSSPRSSSTVSFTPTASRFAAWDKAPSPHSCATPGQATSANSKASLSPPRFPLKVNGSDRSTSPSWLLLHYCLCPGPHRLPPPIYRKTSPSTEPSAARLSAPCAKLRATSSAPPPCSASALLPSTGCSPLPPPPSSLAEFR